MRLLEYLVSSRTRREVLRTLRAHAEGLTVNELSRLAGVTYSGAYREVGRLRRVSLISTRRVGRALLCTWKAAKPAATVMELLLDGRGSKGPGSPTDEELAWNLRRWGAPLVETGTPGLDLSLEETLAHAVGLSRRRPEVARVWPVVLARNRSGVDLGDLAAAGRRLGQKRALGFLLSLSATLLRDKTLAAFAGHLRDRRSSVVRDFFLTEHGVRARRLAQKRSPALARQWLFWMNMPMESFESFFRKHGVQA